MISYNGKKCLDFFSLDILINLFGQRLSDLINNNSNIHNKIVGGKDAV